jgi:Alpha-(1,6)-fucosyltransferase N- and catalytic domains
MGLLVSPSKSSFSLKLSILFNVLLLLYVNHRSIGDSTNMMIPLVWNDPHHLPVVDGIIRNDTNDYASKSASSEPIGICTGKDGILLIQRGDQQSAIGTMFFLYAVNHLIYADMNNLQPWMHFLPTPPCHDPEIHGTSPVTFQMMTGVKETDIHGKGPSFCKHNGKDSHYPGELRFSELKPMSVTLEGNGIFDTYFQTLGNPALDPSCRMKPLLILKPRSVDPGMHFCAPWAAQAWPHQRIPRSARPTGQKVTVHEWFQTKRVRAAKQVRNYYKPQPWLRYHIRNANPSSQCLSMHIRMTDKGNGRVRQPLVAFQRYAEAYAKASRGNPIYVATDDATVLRTIETDWNIATLLFQQGTIRMEGGDSAIFHKFMNETHRINTEGLVDIYAMSKCDFFVHGYSAMAEATIFINLDLHNRSVNLDLPSGEIMPVSIFQNIVSEFYHINDTTLDDYQFPKKQIPKISNSISIGTESSLTLQSILSEQIRVQNMFQDIIHRNQHPTDCTTRRLLLSWRRPNPYDGFTLELQDLGRRLMTALATDRTFIIRDTFRSAYAPEGCVFSTGVRVVDATNSWTCLYNPVSNCTESMTDWKNSARRDDRVNSSLVSGLGVVDGAAKSLFFSTIYYGDVRVMEGARNNIANQIDIVENWERMLGRYWIRSQMAAYLWKPSIGLQSEIDARFPIGLFNSKVPYIGMHIRFTDNRLTFAKDFGRDPTITKSLAHYMTIAEEIRKDTNISDIFLATDSSDVMEAVRTSKQYDHWTFHIQQANVSRSNSNDFMWFKNNRNQMSGSIATDVEVLRRADYLIGSFGSNVYRLVAQLNTAFMVDRYPWSRIRHRTVDVDWYEDP